MKVPCSLKLLSTMLAFIMAGSGLLPRLEAAPSDEPLSLAELKQQYPNATFIQVTPEELQQWTQVNQGHILVAQAGAVPGTLNDPTLTNTNTAAEAIYETGSPKKPRQQPHSSYRKGKKNRPDTTSSYYGTDLFLDITRGNWGGGDADIVLFVLIGVVVTAAFIVYAGSYLFRLATFPEDIEYWWDLELHSTWLTGNNEHGYLVGLRLLTGFKEEGAIAGLVLEGGYFNITAELDKTPSELEADGAYGMAGPHIRWPWNTWHPNPSYAAVELLAGGTTYEDAGMISAARFAVSLGIGEYTRMGFTIGALYVDLGLEDGLVREDDNFSTIIGLDFGFRL